MERFTFRTVGGTAMLYLGNSSEWAIISGRNNHEYKISGDAAERLAAYEDTGLEPEDLKKAFNETAILKLAAQALSTTPNHLRDLLKAEQDGRLVVLPCGTDVELERDGHTFKADHWNHTLTAFRDAPENKSGKQVALFSIEEAEAALAQEGDSEQ